MIEQYIKNEFYAQRYIRFLESYVHKEGETFEKHHIAPKSLFPDLIKDENNLIKISPRVHFMCHKMLVRVFDGRSMWAALSCMILTNKSSFFINSRLYEQVTQKRLDLLKSEHNPMTILASKGMTPSSIRRKDGTHWLKGKNNLNYNVPPWKNFGATVESKIVWFNADLTFNVWRENPSLGLYKIKTKIEKITGFVLPEHPFESMMKKFKSGWVPEEDKQWLEHKSNFVYDITKIRPYLGPTTYPIRPWLSKTCTNNTKLIWKHADLIFSIFIKNPSYGAWKLRSVCKEEFGIDFKNTKLELITERFRKGWVPDKDPEWIKFKNNNNKIESI